MKKFHNCNGGFSLAELVVAVVILGIITVPLLHTLITGANTARKSAEVFDATAAAQSLMEMVKAQGAGAVYEKPPLLQNGVKYDKGTTNGIRTIEIDSLISGSREYKATVTIDASARDDADDDNTVELAVSNSMDAANTANLKYADEEGEADFKETFKTAITHTDEEGNEVFDGWAYPDTSSLARHIYISSARCGDDYYVRLSFVYTEPSRAYHYEAVSAISFKDVPAPLNGQAAFSIYVIFNAHYKTSCEIDIINDSPDTDFNVFLINTSENLNPIGSIIYKDQQDTAVQRVFSNFDVTSYSAYKGDYSNQLVGRINSTFLVETAAVRRRYLVTVTLRDREGAELCSFSENMLV